MKSISQSQDKVWVATFQLVWNDLVSKVIHTPIYFPDGTPAMVKELNRQDFTTEDLSKESYYKTTKRISSKTRKKIEKGIHKKFNENSDILDQIDWTPDRHKYIIYAMLNKDFLFLNEFDKLGQNKFGEIQTAEYFGIGPNTSEELRNTVEILYYNSKDDFAIKLLTQGKDEVYLYKCSANKPFNILYMDMLKKSTLYKKENEIFSAKDELKVPKMNFFKETSFEELTDKRIKGTNLYLSKALETIKFNMDNKGVELKSEAAIATATCSPEPEAAEPKLFHLDDTFVMFIQERTSKRPYFALRVYDITNYQKN